MVQNKTVKYVDCKNERYVLWVKKGLGGCLEMLLLAVLAVFYLPLYVIFALTKNYK